MALPPIFSVSLNYSWLTSGRWRERFTGPDAFLPKSVTSLKATTRSTLGRDLIAGITVGLVALPLALAFAISSGVSPASGIACAVVAGFLISALGGSRCQVGGPTGAFVVVVSGIVGVHGIDGLFMCTMMAGVILAVMGLTGLGTAVKYIPRPVVIGFTNGIAVLIASTQIKEFFGLPIEKVPGEFLARMQVVGAAFPRLDPITTGVSIAALLLIIAIMRWLPRVPGAVVALFAGTAIAAVFNLGVATVGSRYGALPAGLPPFKLPQFRPELFLTLLSPALTVAMLGAIESLLSAVVADRMSGDRHNPNVELFAQGLANIASPLVGGLPATGAIARTATNIRAGAASPIAGMTHSVVLLVILLVAAPLAAKIPLAVLAAILLTVAYGMGEWREIPGILRLGAADTVVWAITFALTVFADLTVAVEAGMILAALLFISRVSSTTTVSAVSDDYLSHGEEHSLLHNPLPEGVAVYRIHGPFLFGSTDKLETVEENFASLPPVVVLRLRNMTAIDGTGMHAIERLADRLHGSGRHLLICGMRNQPEWFIRRSGFAKHIGEANITPHLRGAVQRSQEILDDLSDEHDRDER